ncbi:probable transcription factor RL9 [Ananas comosus]|uniref:Probable transcription factor RL9 n=1 Tax=Ananas comosus TaxID=4615 RepID=A0A6P5EJ64_ANACO|nr:probable transcription factor RL9 [Ananas comosus]
MRQNILGTDIFYFRKIRSPLLPRRSSSASPALRASAAPPAAVAPRRAPFKLRDRRGGALHLRLSPSPLRHHHHHHRSSSSFAGAQSPTTPSPKSPLGSDPLFSPPPAASSPSPGKETAIPANRFFFLPPSPRILSAAAAAAPPASPELLPLFPLSSPAQRRRGDEESSIGDKSM